MCRRRSFAIRRSLPACSRSRPLWGETKTAPYFHDNSAKTLEEVAAFYTDLFATGTPEDFTHLELRRAPDVTYTVASDYARDIGPGNANFRVSYNWRSDYEGTLDNHSGTSIDAFGVLDASLSYSWGNWTAALFGTNLTDEDAYSHTYAVVPNSLGGTLWKFATPRVPRNYGVQVTYEFGR